MKRFLLPALTALALTLTLSSCEKNDATCGCTPLPRPPVVVAALTQTNTWYLNRYTAAGQTTDTAAIKDRFALRFAADGSYHHILLNDNSATTGTWKLTGADNRQLNLIDYKGAPQNFTVEGLTEEILYLSRFDRAGQPEMYLFKPTR